MKTKLTITLFIFMLIISACLFQGCVKPIIKYDSQVGNPRLFDQNCEIEVRINDEGIPKSWRNEKTRNSIENSITNDLKANLFSNISIDEYEMKIIVEVNKIRNIQNIPSMLPCITLMLAGALAGNSVGSGDDPENPNIIGSVIGELLPIFLGVPMIYRGYDVDIGIKILNYNDVEIAYFDYKKTNKGWLGLYYGKQYNFTPNNMLKKPFEELKKQIINQRQAILQKLEDSNYEEIKQEEITQYAGPILSIAVLNLKAIQVPDPVALIVSDILRDELFQTQRFKIMSRTEMDAIFKEHAFVLTGACDDIGCYIEVGKMLTVEKLIVGNLSQLGSIYYLSLKMVDVNTAQYEKIASARGPASDDELFSIVKSAVMNLISD